MREAAASSGNAEFRLFGHLLRAVTDAADQLLDRHGDEAACECRFCGFEHAIGGLRDDVAGIRWQADRNADAFRDCTYGGGAAPTGTLARRLRHIADEMDRLDLSYAATTDDHGDEPAIVGAPPG